MLLRGWLTLSTFDLFVSKDSFESIAILCDLILLSADDAVFRERMEDIVLGLYALVYLSQEVDYVWCYALVENFGLYSSRYQHSMLWQVTGLARLAAIVEHEEQSWSTH